MCELTNKYLPLHTTHADLLSFNISSWNWTVCVLTLRYCASFRVFPIYLPNEIVCDWIEIVKWNPHIDGVGWMLLTRTERNQFCWMNSMKSIFHLSMESVRRLLLLVIYLFSAIENVIEIEVSWSCRVKWLINQKTMCNAYPNTKYCERELFRV